MGRATIEQIERLLPQIPDNWALCELFRDHRRASEAEMMVAQTIHAAKLNFDEHGKPFSFRGDGVFGRGGGGLVDNGTAYSWLVGEGWFEEDTHDGKPVIYMTEKLIERLDAHCAKEKS
jgi:hypothetical protein